MRTPRGWLAWVALAALATRPTYAQVAVTHTTEVAREAPSLEVAVSTIPERSTWWVRLTYDGSAAQVTLIVPVPQGARVDLQGDEWFEALHEATDPRVCAARSSCPATDAGVIECQRVVTSLGPSTPSTPSTPPIPSRPSTPGASASPHDRLWSLAELLVWTSENKMVLTVDTIAQLARYERSGTRFVMAHFPTVVGRVRTQTLRITTPTPNPQTPDAQTPDPQTHTPGVPLLLSNTGLLDVSATVWIFGPGVARPTAAPLEGIDRAKLTIQTFSPPRSNYDQTFAEALAAHGDGWILEGSNRIFGGPTTSGVADAPHAPSVVQAYLPQVVVSQDAGLEGNCLARAMALASDPRPLGLVCPVGGFARGIAAADDPCAGSAQEEERAATLRCGSQDDLALALGGQTPNVVRWTRWRGVLPAGTLTPNEPYTWGTAPSVSPDPELTARVPSACAETGPGPSATVDASRPVSPASDGAASTPSASRPDASVTSPSTSRSDAGTWSVVYTSGSSGSRDARAPTTSPSSPSGSQTRSTSQRPRTSYASSNGSCGGSATTSHQDSCSGSATTPTTTSTTASSDDQVGAGAEGCSCANDSGPEDEGADEGADDSDDAATDSSDDMGCGRDDAGDDTHDSCSRDDGDEPESCSSTQTKSSDPNACSVGPRRRRHPVRLSAVAMTLLGICWPIRRMRRRPRTS